MFSFHANKTQKSQHRYGVEDSAVCCLPPLDLCQSVDSRPLYLVYRLGYIRILVLAGAAWGADGGASPSSSSMNTNKTELGRRILPTPRSIEVRVSHSAYVMARYNVRFFRSIERFNDDDCNSRILVLSETCTETSRVSSMRSGRLWYGSGNCDMSMARSDGGSGPGTST